MELLTLPIDTITAKSDTQSRAELNEQVVADYAEIIRHGGEFPPVVVFEDGSTIWLADGFHRFHAHRAAGAMEITCDVRQGSKRDAILYSLGVNASHGLRRTNEDKRRSVLKMLNDAEWSQWSDREIAKACGVSNNFVGDVRKSICHPMTDAPAVRTVERNGKTYEQNTANIGKTAPKLPAPTIEEELEAEEVDAFGPSDEEIDESLREEAEQLEYIKGLLANEDDPLSKALADVKMYRERARTVQILLDGEKNKNNELIRSVKSLQAKLRKLEQGA